MNKDIFLKHLNSFQDKAIKELKNHNKVIIKSTKYTGKSVICKKLFESLNNGMIIYHTGCAPELFKSAKIRLLELINDDKVITLILDEFYDKELLELISKKNNINCYVVTNDSSLNINNFKVFNYYEFYKKFMINEIGSIKNVHEVMSGDKDFNIKHEYLRTSSIKTITYIKENDSIDEEIMEA